MNVTFCNITVTVDAVDPKAAYKKLCEALAVVDVEYVTDTYVVEPDGKNRPTTELMDY